MKKTILIISVVVLIIGAVYFLFFNKTQKLPAVTEIKLETPTTCSGLSLSQARTLAKTMESDCQQQGQITDEAVCNEYTHTWWLGFSPQEEKPGCNPACVVNADTSQVEINWRCTGLITP